MFRMTLYDDAMARRRETKLTKIYWLKHVLKGRDDWLIGAKGSGSKRRCRCFVFVLFFFVARKQSLIEIK